ncbi:MAG TPA: methyltransferase [Thermoplasmata archaeon]|nr:methyltransferase [Thermoplasmata archaeon]
MRQAALARKLQEVPGFPAPRADLEQVVTPPEAAATLLLEALARGDLLGRRVADLGSGTGRLALGAAVLGADPVVGWEADPVAVEVARATARRWGLPVRFEARAVVPPGPDADTVLMNPPFGAQKARADRPFWEAALGGSASAVYAFALSDSRSFIERRAVAHAARLDERRPIDWTFPATFRHHRERAVRLAVDLWVLHRTPPP